MIFGFSAQQQAPLLYPIQVPLVSFCGNLAPIAVRSVVIKDTL